MFAPNGTPQQGGIAARSAGQWVESAYFAREHPEGRAGQVVQILKVALAVCQPE